MSTAAGSAFDLQVYLARERAAVDAALRGLLDDLLADAPLTLAAPARYALEAGGKRLRPVLCVAAYRAARAWAAGGVREQADPAPAPAGAYEIGCALEFVHTYSLVHDDLPCMDDDDLRRGRATVHRVYGAAPAVIAGAWLIPLAVRVLERGGRALELDDATRVRLVRQLCTAAGAGGMVGGQVLDIAAEGRAIGVRELEAIHARKTAALLAAAPRIGAIAAGADDRIVAALGTYGRRLGLAFQITDDVLDVTGKTAALGKTAGRDAALAKATYPALLGLAGARARAEAEAEAALAALRGAGLRSLALEALARYTVERDR